MLNLKKTAVAVLAFGSSAVFAGTMGPVCTPGSVTVPCPRTAWDFGAQALYLQATHAGMDYLGSIVNIIPQSETYLTQNQKWGWGFQIEGSYHFNTGNDLNLNWYHLDKTSNRAATLGTGQNLVDYLGNSFSGAGGINAATGLAVDNIGGAGGGISVSGTDKWDAVNLEFGQHVDMGEFVNMRFHGGVEFARIKNSTSIAGSLTGTFVAAGTAPTLGAGTRPGTAQVVNSSMSYNGFGPRVGTDLGYGWNNGVAVYAKGAMSLLVGQSKFNRVSTVAVGIPAVASASGSSTTVNPELEAKLGATYTYAMAQGDLSLDIGWMWVNYFSVLNDASTFRFAGNRVSDFGLQGPYVGLKWVGNVA